MICPNLRIGCPLAMACAAILWPRMIRAVAVTPATVAPASTASTATTILSRGLSRSVRGLDFAGLSCMLDSRCCPHHAPFCGGLRRDALSLGRYRQPPFGSQGIDPVNLSSMLKSRAAEGKPIRVGQIGAGKFGTMFLSQVRLTTGMHLVALADLAPQRAKDRLLAVGWPAAQLAGSDPGEAYKSGKTFLTDDAMAVITHPQIEVVIEATGDPATGIRLCQAAIQHGKHIVMVNVEADALAGPLLARQARDAA